jgi:hypothetical protein
VFVARCAVLSCCCCLRRHLKIANLTLRKSTIVVVRALLLMLWLFDLLWLLWWLWCLRVVHLRLFAEWTVQVNAGRCRRYLALRLE